MNHLKEKYNKLIKRAYNGEKYLDNPSTPLKEVEKWIPTFNLIVIEISVTQSDIQKSLGIKMTEEEIWNGFKEV